MSENLEKRTLKNGRKGFVRKVGNFLGLVGSLGILGASCTPGQQIYISLPGISVDYRDGELEIERDDNRVNYEFEDDDDNYDYLFDDEDDDWHFDDWFDWDDEDRVNETVYVDVNPGVDWPVYLPDEGAYLKQKTRRR